MPIARAAGEARDLQAQHQTDLAEADLGDQALKTGAVGGRGPRVPQILVDHDDAFVRPPQGECSFAQGVLPCGALGVLEDLLERALADVQAREPLKVTGSNRRRRHRSTSTWLSVPSWARARVRHNDDARSTPRSSCRSSASARRSTSRMMVRPVARWRNGSGAAREVHAVGSDFSFPDPGSRKNTRDSPQAIRSTTSSKCWPARG
jgi:hypothetical protein